MGQCCHYIPRAALRDGCTSWSSSVYFPSTLPFSTRKVGKHGNLILFALGPTLTPHTPSRRPMQAAQVPHNIRVTQEQGNRRLHDEVVLCAHYWGCPYPKLDETRRRADLLREPKCSCRDSSLHLSSPGGPQLRKLDVRSALCANRQDFVLLMCPRLVRSFPRWWRRSIP